jgi:hypothetical protein
MISLDRVQFISAFGSWCVNANGPNPSAVFLKGGTRLDSRFGHNVAVQLVAVAGFDVDRDGSVSRAAAFKVQLDGLHPSSERLLASPASICRRLQVLVASG